LRGYLRARGGPGWSCAAEQACPQIDVRLTGVHVYVDALDRGVAVPDSVFHRVSDSVTAGYGQISIDVDFEVHAHIGT